MTVSFIRPWIEGYVRSTVLVNNVLAHCFGPRWGAE